MKIGQIKLTPVMFAGLLMLFMVGGMGGSATSCSGDADCTECMYYEAEMLIEQEAFNEALTISLQYGFRDLEGRSYVGLALSGITTTDIFANATSAVGFLNALQQDIAGDRPGACSNFDSALATSALSEDLQLISVMGQLANEDAGGVCKPSDSDAALMGSYFAPILNDVPEQFKNLIIDANGSTCATYACVCAAAEGAGFDVGGDGIPSCP